MNIAKRVFITLCSMIFVFNSIVSANAAPSAWSLSSISSAGANVLATATKGGLKSAVNIAPNALRVARFGFSLRSPASLVLFLAQMNSINNPESIKDVRLESGQIKFTDITASTTIMWSAFSDAIYESAQAAADYYCRNLDGAQLIKTYEGGLKVEYMCNYNKRRFDAVGYVTETTSSPKTVPLADFSDQVVSSAARGSAPAQSFLQDVAAASVAAGEFDQDFMAGAVPIADDKPVIPVVPNPTAGDYDGLITGGDVGAQVTSALDRLDAARKAAAAALSAANAAADASRAAAAAANDVIGSSADQVAKDAAAASAAAAAGQASAAAAAADAAANAVSDAAQEVIDKARTGANAAASDIAKLQAALAAAQAAGDTAAANSAAAALSTAKDVAAAMAAAQAKAIEAIKEAASSSAAKNRELPAFCRWASPVCDAVDWLMKPDTPIDTDTDVVVDDQDVEAADTDINFGGSCPANFEVNSSIFGNPIHIVLLDTGKFCSFLTTFVKYPVYAVSSLYALYILGGRKDV